MANAQTDFLREYLANTDAACPGCGYNLRGLPGAQCPKCGDEIKLQIGLVEPRIAANIAGLIGLAAGAGFRGLLLVFMLIVTIFKSGGGPPLQFLLVNLGGLIVEGTALILWLGLWRRIRRFEADHRWLLVTACWLLTLANIIVFSIIIR